MKAACLEPNQQLTVRDIARPALPDDGALIRVTACGICGSDIDKIFYRQTPTGTVLGHEVAGVIEAVSPAATERFTQFRPGQRVALAHHAACLTCAYCRQGSYSMCRAFKSSALDPGGFAQTLAVTGAHLAQTVFALPDEIPDAWGTCVEPLACCIRAVDRLPGTTPRHVALIGLGFIGLLTAQWLQHQGDTVYGLDLSPERAELAKNLGWLTATATEGASWQAAVREATDQRGADVVFMSVVNEKTLALALSTVRDGGTLMLFAASPEARLDIASSMLYFREIAVLTSYSPSPESLRRAHEAIINRTVAVSPLLTALSPLDSVNEAIDAYRQGRILKGIVAL